MPLILPPLRLPVPGTFTPTYEYRARFERRTDRDFQAAQNDNRGDLLGRHRIGLRYDVDTDVDVYAQYQYGHDISWTDAVNRSDENSDLYQGYVESRKLGLIVGRQTVSIEDQRLFGLSNWTNAGRAWDAIHWNNKNWEFVGGHVAVGTGISQEDRAAAGIAKTRFGNFGIWFKHDTLAAGTTDIWTVNHELSTSWGKVAFNSNLAYQRGHELGLDQNAWAIHLRATEKTSPSDTVLLDYLSASGGSDANTNRTFDPMYPNGHDFAGIMDLQGWKNVDQLSASFQHDLAKDYFVRVRAITSELRDPSDGWYQSNLTLNKSGAVTFQDPTGNSGRDLGRELDFELQKPLNRDFQGLAGVAFFFPGDFVKNISGDNRNQMYAYLMVQAKY